MTRRAFLKRCAGAVVGIPAVLRAGAGGERSDSDLLAEAEDRIRQHRRCRRVVVVRDARGRPVSGANVRVEQTRHEYRFGCNLFLLGRGGDADWEREYRERFVELFNFATLPFYWSRYEPRPGQPDYEGTEMALAWAKTHGIVCKGHPLVWDHPASSPFWLPQGDEELAQLVEKRVFEIVSRFRGRLDIWDVVNEPTHLPDRANQTRMARWGERLGPVPYTRRPLELARRANPAATLLVNDYRLDDAYYEILDQLRGEEGHLLFDAVGLQSHMHGGVWPLARVWRVCDRFATLGRPLHFTEITLVSGPRLGPGEYWGPTTPELEERQAEQVERFYTMGFAHPATEALVWWDLSDRGAWQRAAAGLLRRDMSPKPAYERLRELIKRRWWTRTEVVTGPDGECAVEAYYGWYRVAVEAGQRALLVREVDWSRRGPERLEITL